MLCSSAEDAWSITQASVAVPDGMASIASSSWARLSVPSPIFSTDDVVLLGLVHVVLIRPESYF